MVLDVYIRGYLLKLKFVFARTWRFLLMQDRLGAAMLICKNGMAFDEALNPYQGNGMDYLFRQGYLGWQYNNGRKLWLGSSTSSQLLLREFVQGEAKKLGKRVSSDCVEVYS